MKRLKGLKQTILTSQLFAEKFVQTLNLKPSYRSVVVKAETSKHVMGKQTSIKSQKGAMGDNDKEREEVLTCSPLSQLWTVSQTQAL